MKRNIWNALAAAALALCVFAAGCRNNAYFPVEGVLPESDFEEVAGYFNAAIESFKSVCSNAQKTISLVFYKDNAAGSSDATRLVTAKEAVEQSQSKVRLDVSGLDEACDSNIVKNKQQIQGLIETEPLTALKIGYIGLPDSAIVEAIKDENNKAKAKIEEIKQENYEYNAKNNELHQQISEYNALIAEKEQEIEQKNGEIADCDKKIEQAKATCDVFSGDAEAEDVIAALRAYRDKKVVEKGGIQIEIQAIEDNISDNKLEIAKNNALIATNNESIANNEVQVADCEASIARYNAQTTVGGVTNAELEAEYDEKLQALGQLTVCATKEGKEFTCASPSEEPPSDNDPNLHHDDFRSVSSVRSGGQTCDYLKVLMELWRARALSEQN